MKSIKFITYHILSLGGNSTPIAVDCSDLSKSDIENIYFDAHSLHGLSRVKVNRCGKLRKDVMQITPQQHWKYEWDSLCNQYYDKMFNPKNF